MGAYERVIERADRDLATGCLVSRYSVGSHGYAQAYDGKVTLAHLVVWRHHHGPVPDGMTVDHRCHNRRCVEIAHLRLLTNLENARRNRPGVDWPLDGRCKNGHPASAWRPKTTTNRKGYCRECRNEIQRAYRSRALT